MLNNSQEYSSNQAKREAMLQQIILEQKQKIRDLEQSSKKSNTLPQFKQQLMECTNQLEESKNIITQLLQQKEQLTQELEEHKQQENVKLNQQIMEIQEQFNVRQKQLESENQALQEELQQCQPLSKALNNYTQEDKYIQQINALYEFITTWQKQNMSEIVYYKRALEVQQNSSEQMSQRCQDEKKELQQQLNQLIKIDEKIQEDILLKLQQVTDGFSKFQNEIQSCQVLFQGNYEQIEEKLNSQIESSKVIFMNKGILSQVYTNTSEQSFEQDVSQVEYLKSENAQLKQAIEDMKVLNIHREKALKMEIERYRNKCDFFIQQTEQREQQFRDEQQKIVKQIEQIEKNFNSRENFYKFDHDQLQILLDNFRIIVQQIGNELKIRKGNEHIKECKDLLYKLTQKRQKPKPIKNLEKLENICKDLLKHPPPVKQNDEIKELILDVSKQILNSQEYRSQTTLLFEGLDQLEGLITSPSRRVDVLLDQFYKELQQLTKIREATFQQNEIFNEIKESLQQTPKQQGVVDKSDLEYVEKLRELEKEQYKQEIEIAVIRSEKLLESQELKVKHLEYQLRKQETYINQQLQQNQKQQTEQEALIKQQKQQIAKLQKLVNEIQQQRIMDRKELLKLIQESEQKQIDSFNSMIKQIDTKCKTVIEIVNKKLGKLAKGKIKEKEEQVVHKSTDEHVKQLQQKDKERDEQFQSKLDELGHIIQELKSNIENLHKEKGSLIEQLDGMNKVLQTQKKLYYSFRQQ